jgi:microcystin-dependent protein
MTTKFNRPAGTYAGASGLANRTKYQEDSVAVPKRAISSGKIDGDFNYVVDGLNETWAALTAASFATVLPDQAANTDKVPVTNGTSTSWQKVTGAVVSDATVGLEKLVNVGTGKVLASGATGAVEAASLGDGLTLTGSVLSAALPAGMLMASTVNTAPAGWLLCSGGAVSRTAYAALFAAIGTTYGAGDNSTTFNLPDLRGRVVLGKDDMGGADSGRLSISNALGSSGGAQLKSFTTDGTALTVAQLPAHNHGERFGSLPLVRSGANGPSVSGNIPTMGSTATDTQNLTDNAGSGQTHSHTVSNIDILPPYMVLNWLIKT